MKKTLLFFTLVAISLFATSSTAQSDEAHLYITHADHDHHLSAHFSCGYEGEDILIEKGHSFASNQEAIQVVNDIMNAVGLKANFKVQGAKVQNAAAVVMNNERYILYSSKFINSVSAGAKTNWGGISVIAHEIGHHLNGHTLQRSGSRPKTELEADEFSGFVLRKMGASLEESQAAMRLLANPYGSATHPAQGERLIAIEKGWRNADRMMGGTVDTEIPSRPKPNRTKPRPNKPQKEDESVAETEKPTKPAPTPPVKPNKSKVRPAYAQYSVVLSSNPNSTYYITSGNQFVVVKRSKIYILGQIKKTGNDKYPFVIDMEQSSDLFINRQGKLFTRTGNTVGQLEEV